MSAEKAIKTPEEKVRTLQIKLSCAAKQSITRRFGALYDKVYRMNVLWVAWKRVRANDGAPGYDQADFECIEKETGAEKFLTDLHGDLYREEYRPQPVLRCWIDKPGKPDKRPLGIPTIRDRVAQMAIKLIIEPIFETNFMPCSHGFRPGRSCHTAMREIDRAITFDGMKAVIDADIVGCFNNIRHDLLLQLISRRISDKRVLRLIRAWLKAGVMEDGVYKDSGDVGSPQGGVISPLLSNIYLHTFDKMFAQSGIQGKLVRYCDDFVVLVKGDARRALELVRSMLKKLGLEMHSGKTRLADVRDGFDFLGVHFRLTPTRKAGARRRAVCRMWPSDKSIRSFKLKVKEAIGRKYFLAIEDIVKILNPVIRGWNNYQTRGAKWVTPKRFIALNRFVYERIRIFLKRKYEDKSRGYKRVSNSLLLELGLAQFG